MFKRKPPPPHSENLTQEQIKIMRKIMHAPYYDMVGHVNLLHQKGWIDVFSALAQQDAMSLERMNGQYFFYYMTEVLTPYQTARVLPLLHDENNKFVPWWASQTLLKLDDEAAKEVMLEKLSGRVNDLVLQKVVAAKDDHARDCVKALLKAGADIHADGATAMKSAISAENFDIADDLMAAGFDLPLYAEYIRAYLLQNDASREALVYFDQLTGKSAQLVPAQESEYVRSGDSVSRVETLAGGGSLTTVFNFASLQQIVIAHVAGQTTTPVITPFSQIEGRAGLRAAAQAFIAQGGDAQIEAIINSAGRTLLIDKKAGGEPG